MGYVDPLGRFIRDPDVDSLDGISPSSRKTASNPIQFLTNLVRNDQEELVCIIIRICFSLINDLIRLSFCCSCQAMEEAAARFAETFISEITTMTANLDNQ